MRPLGSCRNPACSICCTAAFQSSEADLSHCLCFLSSSRWWGRERRCLLENFAVRLTRASWGRQKQWSSVTEPVATFLHATLTAQGDTLGVTYCMKSHPPTFACLYKTKRDASSVYVGNFCPKSASLSWMRVESGVHQGVLVFSLMQHLRMHQHGAAKAVG